MLKQGLLAAIYAVNCASAFVRTENFWQNADDVTPAPGNFQMFLNVPSMSSLIKDASAFAPYYTVIGKSYDVNFDWSSKLADISIKQVNVTNLVIADASMTFVNDTNTIRTMLTGANLFLDLDATVKTALGIKIDLQNLTLTNVTLQLDAITTSDNQVNWQLSVDPYFNVDDIEVMCKQKMWQKVIDGVKPELMKVVRYGLSFGQGVVMGLVDVLNNDLQNQTDDMFVFNFKGLPLNMTMTRFPEFNNTQQEIILNFDGLFTSEEMLANADHFQSIAGQQQREQIWLHQSMINSLIYSLTKTIATRDAEGKVNSIGKQIYALVPEVFRHYGKNADCTLKVSFPDEINNSPIIIDKTRGIVVGDNDSGMIVDVQAWCAEDSVQAPELALDIQLGVHTAVNATWDNFVYWIELNDVKALSAVVTSPVVTLDYHNWVAEFTALLKDASDEFNMKYATPTDIKASSVVIGFVAGILRSTLLSPFVEDEYLLAGFKMITDPKDPMAVADLASRFLQ